MLKLSKIVLTAILILTMAVSVFGLSLTQTINNTGTIRTTETGMQVGINYLSNGNAWTESNATLQRDFARFSNDGVKHLSCRIMWSVMMPSSGQLSTTAVNNVRRVLDIANQYDIKINLDFWCQFGYTLGYPTSWAGSNYYSLLNSPYQGYWLSYVTQVVNTLKGYPALESWAILNEPYFESSGQKTAFQTLIHNCVTTIKQNDPNHIVICRFTLSYTPASGRYDESVYNDFDVIAITEYLDPSNPSDTRYNGRWSYWEGTVSYCQRTGKPLWVIEFGDDGTETHNALHYTNSLNLFVSDNVARAYAWAWQSGSAGNEAFNIFDGTNPMDAYNVLKSY